MENVSLNYYIINGKLDIDKLIDDFYGYIYSIVKNSVSIYITNEDIEEIISDVFVAIWKNSSKLSETTILKPYLVGTAKNVIKNKYRKKELNFSISDYEENLIDNNNIERIVEENEQDSIILNFLRTLKSEEHEIFIMFYYEAKSIKKISKKVQCSEGKVKVILHRVRKMIKKKLEDGGYSYGK